jgi:hypothetical protein
MLRAAFYRRVFLQDSAKEIKLIRLITAMVIRFKIYLIITPIHKPNGQQQKKGKGQNKQLINKREMRR